MVIRSLLALSVASIFRAPEGGGGGGGETLTLEQRLENALASVGALTSERDTATGQLAARDASIVSLTTERDTIRGQFDALTTSANQLQADLVASQGQVATVTGERDTARNSLALSEANVGRLETLCRLRGVDPKEAVTPSEKQAAENKLTMKAFEALDHEARNQFIRGGGKISG